MAHAHTSPNPFDQQSPVPGIQNIVAVASGKGGVGKSTVSANLAVALAQSGARVGLLDADIYGPSIPRMLGALHQRPEIDQTGKIEPLSRYGVKLMSIGFLVDDNQAIVWRGPMLFKALDQFLRDVNWGELDFLLVDLPPGTGDIQLSLAQKVPVAGAITVSTPQNVALMDVKRSVEMFRRIGVPLLGLIENMSCFVTPGSNERVQLFPKGELEAFLKSQEIPKLGEIPFYPSIAMGGEIGIPVAENTKLKAEGDIFREIARGLMTRLNKKH